MPIIIALLLLLALPAQAQTPMPTHPPVTDYTLPTGQIPDSSVRTAIGTQMLERAKKPLSPGAQEKVDTHQRRNRLIEERTKLLEEKRKTQ